MNKKKVIIVAPHFPPSNLAGVHRSRLFAQHLPEFGWLPIVVTVRPERYEERLDHALTALLPADLRIERVGAFPILPFRVIGDIGIRGFLPMLRRIVSIVKRERIDLVYIPIPSFYAALLGRLVNAVFGTAYGIDYIDPWVQPAAGSEQLRARISLALARLLEPVAVRNASLITGVAEGYYEPMLARNPHVARRAVTAAMPYGGEMRDHEQVCKSKVAASIFPPRTHRFRFVYAGAMLPRAADPLRRICSALAKDADLRNGVEFFFIGTGKSPDDRDGYNVRPIAEEYGLWGDVMHEHPARIPYLETIAHLEAADAVFVLGSTEPHYTPSKVYQGVLSGKPVLAVLHGESSACAILRETGAGVVIEFAGENDTARIEELFAGVLRDFMAFARTFDPARVNRSAFDKYSARAVTARLASAMDEAISGKPGENERPRV